MMSVRKSEKTGVAVRTYCMYNIGFGLTKNGLTTICKNDQTIAVVSIKRSRFLHILRFASMS